MKFTFFLVLNVIQLLTYFIYKDNEWRTYLGGDITWDDVYKFARTISLLLTKSDSGKLWKGILTGIERKKPEQPTRSFISLLKLVAICSNKTDYKKMKADFATRTRSFIMYLLIP